MINGVVDNLSIDKFYYRTFLLIHASSKLEFIA